MSEPLWIDVRRQDEYADEHIRGHMHIPYEQIIEKVDALNLDKDHPIALYCRTGRRSGIAQENLQQAGYTSVTNEGGLEQVQSRVQHKTS